VRECNEELGCCCPVLGFVLYGGTGVPCPLKEKQGLEHVDFTGGIP
jgi:hypothetical protein